MGCGVKENIYLAQFRLRFQFILSIVYDYTIEHQCWICVENSWHEAMNVPLYI